MKQLQLTDYDLIKPFLDMANYEGYNSNFVTMMMWNHEYHIEYEIHDHYLIMLHNFKGVKYFAMPFTTPDYYQEALNYMIAYSKAHHFPFMIDCAIPSFINEVKKIAPDTFIFERTRDLDDYVYEKDMLKNLSGKKMQKRRNHYNNFIKQYPHYEYRTLSIDRDFQLILDCLTKWENDKEATESLTSEIYGILFLLSSKHLLDIKMGGIFIDNELKAFTIASPLNHSTIQMHVEKADKNIRGLYPAICKEFLEHEYPDYLYVNREEDMGLENLRRAKLSMHPCHMVEKSRIFLNDSCMGKANQEDVEAIKVLWKERFEDEDDYSTDFYFKHVYPQATTYVMKFHHKIISVISIEPFKVHGYDESYYVMGVLTDKKYEGQGLMKKLFRYMEKDYPSKRIYLSAYHPEVYQSLGFKETHQLKQVKLSKKDYRNNTEVVFSNKLVGIEELYQQYVSSFKSYRERDKKYYSSFLIPRLEAFHQNIRTFYLFDQLIGYMIYEESEDELSISEFIYLKEYLNDILSCIVLNYDKRIMITVDVHAPIEGKETIREAMMCNQEDYSCDVNFINEVY